VVDNNKCWMAVYKRLVVDNNKCWMTVYRLVDKSYFIFSLNVLVCPYLYWCLQFLIYSSFSELVGAGIHWQWCTWFRLR
jgi:hypothetical protein